MSRNKLLDKLVVIDVEATCDDPKPTWKSETIEVGVCLLDLRTLEITESKGILVKTRATPVTSFCTKLTTLTQELLDKEGVSLFEAMAQLEEDYRIPRRTWASWGDYDKTQLTRDCLSDRFGFPGENSSHINIKNVLAVEYGWRAGEALDRALERFGLNLVGTHHRGKDDAYNVARIYAKHLARVRGL